MSDEQGETTWIGDNPSPEDAAKHLRAVVVETARFETGRLVTPTDTAFFGAIRDSVEDAGLILRGRGRGGTVRRVPTQAPEPVGETGAAVVAEDVVEALQRELDLYEPLRKVIAAEWAREHRAEPLAVEITAQQGRRATGIWARPDIVSIEVRTFEYVPGKFIEVVTFEVKPADGISVQAVYEALAHRRAATRSWVLLHVPDERREELEAAIVEVAEVARGHGIGVIPLPILPITRPGRNGKRRSV